MPVEPEQAQMLIDVIRSGLLDVHTAMPARVDSYDEGTETCKVTPCVRRSRLNDEREIVNEALPQISNIPVMWPSGGGFSLHFPLEKGDFVTLTFSETYAGVFRTSGDVPSNPGELRTHSLASPVAHPGGAYPNGGLPAKLIKVLANGDIELGENATMKIGRADRIEAELALIQAEFIAHTHTGVTTGAGSTGPGVSTYMPGMVGADKGFVE